MKNLMKINTDNKKLLIIITVVLIGIFSLLVFEINKPRPEDKISNLIESVDDDFRNFRSEVKDEIEDTKKGR
jgi:capsular polysaccharide biosynthesis protein